MVVKKGDIVEHAAEASGVAREDVAKVLDTAFAFMREKLIAGEDVQHSRLGRIRVRAKRGEGVVYRFVPAEGGS